MEWRDLGVQFRHFATERVTLISYVDRCHPGGYRRYHQRKGLSTSGIPHGWKKSGSYCYFEVFIYLLINNRMIVRFFLFLDLSYIILYESDIFTCIGYTKDFEDRKLFIEVYEHFILSGVVDLRILVLIIVTICKGIPWVIPRS